MKINSFTFNQKYPMISYSLKEGVNESDFINCNQETAITNLNDSSATLKLSGVIGEIIILMQQIFRFGICPIFYKNVVQSNDTMSINSPIYYLVQKVNYFKFKTW